MTTTKALGRSAIRGLTVKLGETDMYCEEYGSGEPLLLLHGFGGCTRNWHPFISALSQRYRLIVVDLPGHGYSTNPNIGFTHGRAASDVLLLLEALEIDRFSAMGMSSGAMTLLHMATRQPARIDKMILISATTHFPDQARAIMRRASFSTMPHDVREMYRECAKWGDSQIQKLISQFNALGEDYDDMNFTPERLSCISSRTLIIHGDRDRFFPIDIPVGIYRAIPGAALWIVPGGDHVPIYDTTVPFLSTALRFLGRPDAGMDVSTDASPL